MLGPNLITAGIIALCGSLMALAICQRHYANYPEDDFADKAMVKYTVYSSVIAILAVIVGAIMWFLGV